MQVTQRADAREADTILDECKRDSRRGSALDRLAKRAVLNKLSRLQGGRLVLLDGSTRQEFGSISANLPEEIVVRVLDQRFYGDLAFGGSIGAGESYMQGYWNSAQLVDLVRLLVLNQGVLDSMEGGLASMASPVQKLLHALRRNTRSGARRNIEAHYDLGNEFFQLFLDETMMYSAATFIRPQMTLREAQLARLDGICRKLELQPTDHLLEIGSGWGGFAIYAARHYGCRITTTTISLEQYRLARQRVRAAGLEERIDVVYRDYRDLTGSYDKLVSIEMIEAIGHQYFDTYFAKCASLLKPDGAMLLQAITISDQRYERARRSVDFIQRYIFPGSCIPSVSVLGASVGRASDMRIVHLEDIGPHYARTLREWRDNFMASLPSIRALGYDEQLIRMWEFYFCYCEGGFAERAIGDVQLLLVKPGNRRQPIVR
jgi:cyclopropane-fatty-acyl-phospholipid synthase